MNLDEKIQFLNSIQSDLSNLQPLDDNYRVICNRLESFVSNNMPAHLSKKWLEELSTIKWTSRVGSSGDYSKGVRDAWERGKKKTDLTIESIRNELIDERQYQSNYSSAIQRIIESGVDELTITLFSVCPELSVVVESIDKNLKSDNLEDWANAVNSARRILMKLADVLFPATKEPRIGKDGKEHKLTEDHYLNRLEAFVEDHNVGDTNKRLLLSDMERVGKELDAINSADSKGTHSDITLIEAKMYVIHTFIIASEIAVLSKEYKSQDD